MAKVEVVNGANVDNYRRDIEKISGKALPSDEGNVSMIARFFGSDLEYLDRLGLLNRGFCPFCGTEPIDQSHWRSNNFTKTRVFLCASCWKKTHPDAQFNSVITNFDITNADDRKAAPYIAMALLLRNLRWVVLLVASIGVWYYVKR
jgi:hypothetical protein